MIHLTFGCRRFSRNQIGYEIPFRHPNSYVLSYPFCTMRLLSYSTRTRSTSLIVSICLSTAASGTLSRSISVYAY